ncbi:MAG: 4-(cytidine 5'-diphospho)-2-C-methyl-D-erythritol kinase [Deltaproteobacteria bacterium]
MNQLSIKAPAKINLYLDVIGKRSDGYHDLKMIMQTVSLYDEIKLTKISEGIELIVNANIPTGEKNTASKAAKLMLDKFGIKDGVKIEIEKNIPIGAGLAGGSADAAGVIKGMNSLFELGQTSEHLSQLGKKVGADVPFCVIGGTALVEGIGERITQLDSFSSIDVVMVKPNFSVSTAYVFGKYIDNKPMTKPCTEKLIDNMKNHDLQEVGKSLYNALESVTAVEYPVIDEIKEELLRTGAEGSLMSGSGSTVYGIFKNSEEAKLAFDHMKIKYKSTFLVKTI